MQEKKTKKHFRLYLAIIIAIIYLAVLFVVAFQYMNTNRYWDICVLDTTITTESGQDIYVKTIVKNKMYYLLGSSENYFISYHIYDEGGNTIAYENPRTTITDILPGQKGIVNVQIKAPPEKGRYIIEIDMVKEGEYWFKNRGERPGELYLKVD